MDSNFIMYLVLVAELGRAEARHDAGPRCLRDVLRLASALGQQRAADRPEQDRLGEALPDDARVVLKSRNHLNSIFFKLG